MLNDEINRPRLVVPVVGQNLEAQGKPHKEENTIANLADMMEFLQQQQQQLEADDDDDGDGEFLMNLSAIFKPQEMLNRNFTNDELQLLKTALYVLRDESQWTSFHLEAGVFPPTILWRDVENILETTTSLKHLVITGYYRLTSLVLVSRFLGCLARNHNGLPKTLKFCHLGRPFRRLVSHHQGEFSSEALDKVCHEMTTFKLLDKVSSLSCKGQVVGAILKNIPNAKCVEIDTGIDDPPVLEEYFSNLSDGLRKLLESSRVIQKLVIRGPRRFLRGLVPGLVYGLVSTPTLQEICMESQFGAFWMPDIQFLCKGIQLNRSLRRISLFNIVGDDQGWALVCHAAGAHSSLELLCLHGDTFIGRGNFGKSLRNVLATRTNLHQLRLATVDLSRVNHMQEAVAATRSLTRLHVTETRLADSQLAGLFRGAETIPSLQELEITSHEWQEASTAALVHCLGANRMQKLTLGGHCFERLVRALASPIATNQFALNVLHLQYHDDPTTQNDAVHSMEVFFLAFRTNHTVGGLELDVFRPLQVLESLPRHLPHWICLQHFHCHVNGSAESHMSQDWYDDMATAIQSNTMLLQLELVDVLPTLDGNEDTYRIKFGRHRQRIPDAMYAKRNQFKRLVRLERPALVNALAPAALKSACGNVGSVFLGLLEIVHLLPWDAT